MYLSGVSNPAVIAAAAHYPLGLMAQPDSGYAQQIRAYRWWAADNGCYAHARKGNDTPFNAQVWLRWVRSLQQYRATCLFVVAPDVLHWVDGKVIGDAAATLAQSAPLLPIIQGMGYKAALVAQDGLGQLRVPWGSFDALFIGGSDSFKLGWDALALIREANARGIWTHMGRVNSGMRIATARAMGCDSADGTHLAFEPTGNLARIKRDWFTKEEIRNWRQEGKHAA